MTTDWKCIKCKRDLCDWFDQNEPCSKYGGESFKCPHCKTIMEVEYDESYDGTDVEQYWKLTTPSSWCEPPEEDEVNAKDGMEEKK